MIIRVSALTALLLFAAVSCDTEANHRQQKILRRPPPDSIRHGSGPPSTGPSFRPPTATGPLSSGPSFRPPTATAAASAKKPVFINRPKGPSGSGPKVEYGFTPINNPVGQGEVAQASQQFENTKPLIINVQSPAPSNQHGPTAFSYQNSNQQVVEGTFKEKPSFAAPKPQQQPSFVAQPSKTSETQLSFGTFSFNQPVGAKINFEPEQPAFAKNPFNSNEGPVITAGPPKIDIPQKRPSGPSSFPKQPEYPPNFPSFNKEPSVGFSSSRPKEQQAQQFPKHPPQQPSFVKAPPKPIKEQFANFPTQQPQYATTAKRYFGEPPFRGQSFESKKIAHPPPPPPTRPIYHGPPPPSKKVVHQKPSNNFEIQKASVIGPFSGPPIRTLKPAHHAQPPPPRPVSQPPQEAPKSETPTFTQETVVKNPEFNNFPPPGFGSGQSIHQQDVKTVVAPVQQLPHESPNFAQETNPQIFNQNYPTIQVQQPRPQRPQLTQVPQIPSHIHLQLPSNAQGHAVQSQISPQVSSQHFQFQNTQPQFQLPANFQNSQGQLQLPANFQNAQGQLQLPANFQNAQGQLQLPANFQSPPGQLQLPANFQNTQPQLQLPANFQNSQHQFQLPANFGGQQENKFANPFLNSFSSGAGGIPQFNSLPPRLSSASSFGGLSAPGVVSQLGIPSAFPQYNPGLGAAAQLYKGILPVQQQFPGASAGVHPFLTKTAALQSILPVGSTGQTHSISGGVPQFQPLPNSLNFPDQEDDEQDLAASQKHKKFVAPPSASSNSTKSKKTTLKDILAQDCTGAEDFGYCASPPRYPTQQVKTILKRCAEELEGLLQLSEEHHVSKREATAPEQFTWTTEACSSTMATVEPGYARDPKGKWLVVVQQSSKGVHQRVDVDVCGSEGGDCGCKQYFETKNLVAWDPDHPNDCPSLHTFKFPSKCDCPPQQ